MNGGSTNLRIGAPLRELAYEDHELFWRRGTNRPKPIGKSRDSKQRDEYPGNRRDLATHDESQDRCSDSSARSSGEDDRWNDKRVPHRGACCPDDDRGRS
jgi:hypothetical protein